MYISAEHLTKSYGGRTLFRDLNFTLGGSGRLLVTGHSGAGKTTLLRILMKLEPPDEGAVETDLPKKKKGVVKAGCVFQEDRLTESLSAVENIALADGLSKEQQPMIRSRLRELLPEDSLDKPVSQLSGGMRRRVCLVRAVMANAHLLVFDEPFSGLDEASRARCLAFIVREQRGRMMILTSHDGENAPEGCLEIHLHGDNSRDEDI